MLKCFLFNRPSTGIKRADGSSVHHLHSHPRPSSVSSTTVPHMSTAKHFHVWRGIFHHLLTKTSMCWGRWKFFIIHSLLLTGVEVVYITNSLSWNKRFNLCSTTNILLQVISFFSKIKWLSKLIIIIYNYFISLLNMQSIWKTTRLQEVCIPLTSH